MGQFWAAFCIFLLSHIIIARGRLRSFLARYISEKTYLILYSLLSFVLLGWLIVAAHRAPRIQLWPWRHEFYWFPNIIMPFACILLVSGFIVPNPLSIAPKEKWFNANKPGFIVALTRHPILWGFFLWSFSHLLPNGEYPLAFMFFVFAVFSLAGMLTIDKKRKRSLGLQKWQDLSGRTSNILMASSAFRHGQFAFTRQDALGVVLGLILYATLYALHEPIFQIKPTPPL